MMVRNFVLCAALVLGSQAAANASDWHFVGTAGQGNDYKVLFVDKSSIVTDYSGNKQAWVYTIRKTLNADGERKQKALWKFNCEKQTSTLMMYISIGNNDVVKNSYAIPEYSQTTSYIVPDSIGEANAEFACKGVTKDSFSVGQSTPEKAAVMFFRFQK